MLEEILREIEEMEYPCNEIEAELEEAEIEEWELSAAYAFGAAKRMVKDIIRRHMGDDGWIPCGEAMPKKDGTYLCTYDGEYYKEPFVSTDDYDIKHGWRYGTPVAWQPLPKSYRSKQKAVGEDYKQRVMERFMKVE